MADLLVSAKPIYDAPGACFETIKLHLNCGSGPGLVGIVSNRLRESLNSVQNVQLQPRYGILLVACVFDSQSFEEVDNTSAGAVLFIELGKVHDTSLKGKVHRIIALRIDQGRVGDAGVGLFWYISVDQLLVDEVGFYDVEGNVLHELDIPLMPSVQDASRPYHILPMGIDSNLSGLVSPVITLFVDISVDVVKVLLGSDVAFDLGDVD